MSSSESRSVTGSGHEPREHIHVSDERNERSDSSSSLRAPLILSQSEPLGVPAIPVPDSGSRSSLHRTRARVVRPNIAIPIHTSSADTDATYLAPSFTAHAVQVLVSGLESEIGKAPPSYESVAGFEPRPTNGH
ncbi:hypothetical protein PAXRUDRAFT_9652 [Paxillus rubicundulus Ve08.2h10]|uniref:Uncharacterized protein n=1 Tax=Paxillus rubicundulus Ve08.2h10 TaxID=930991 RepID=A0A0D0DIT1_9AGAM|nr:hypothetical protein PAXRUDRAFT_9652 [Paxillus rubicundulus Ve08.2h10]